MENSSKYTTGVKIFDTSHADLEKFIKFYCRLLIPRGEPNKKILIIEQQKEIAEKLKQEFVPFDFDVFCAYDGEEGFAKYIDERPDLIIMDFAAPKLNGLALCRKIRRLQNDHTTPIIMLVTKQKEKDKVKDDHMEVHKCFVKTQEMDDLVSEVKTNFV